MGIRTPDKPHGLYTLSKRAPSTTRTPLHGLVIFYHMSLKKHHDQAVLLRDRESSILFTNTNDTFQGVHRVLPFLYRNGIDTHFDNRIVIATRLSHVTKIQDLTFI